MRKSKTDILEERKTNAKWRKILRHNFSETTLKLEIERKGEVR